MRGLSFFYEKYWVEITSKSKNGCMAQNVEDIFKNRRKGLIDEKELLSSSCFFYFGETTCKLLEHIKFHKQNFSISNSQLTYIFITSIKTFTVALFIYSTCPNLPLCHFLSERYG